MFHLMTIDKHIIGTNSCKKKTETNYEKINFENNELAVIITKRISFEN